MPKIVHVVFCGFQEGYAYQENLLTKKHVELGHDVYVITSQWAFGNEHSMVKLPPRHYVNADGVDVTILPCTNHNPHFARFFDISVGFYDRLCEIQPDVIFIHTLLAKDICHVLEYVRAHPCTKVYIDSHQDYYNQPVKRWLDRFDAWMYSRRAKKLEPIVSKFWGTTPWRVQYFKEVYKTPSEKTDLLIMGADESLIIGKDKKRIRGEIRRHYSIPDEAFVVISGGKIDKRKQQDLLLEAARQLRQDNVWLILFGTPSTEMAQIIDKYDKDPNIILPGWVDTAHSYNLFFASDIALFPGTHSVLWEQSIACGLPLVVKHWKGMEHVNVNGNAIFLDVVNVETIKEVITSLHFTDKLDTMKTANIEISSQFYNLEIAKKSIL